MSKGKVKVNIKGEIVNAVEIGFKTKKEDWNVYSLDDGTTLRFKPVVVKIVRAETYNENYEPVYVLTTSGIVSANVPEKLKKLPK